MQVWEPFADTVHDAVSRLWHHCRPAARATMNVDDVAGRRPTPEQRVLKPRQGGHVGFFVFV